MGAGAFILATWTSIPYGRVALAAAIPAVLYYAALLWAIHFRAAKVGLEGAVAARSEGVLGRDHVGAGGVRGAAHPSRAGRGGQIAALGGFGGGTPARRPASWSGWPR